MPSNAAFYPTIKTVGFQTAFSVKMEPVEKIFPPGKKVLARHEESVDGGDRGVGVSVLPE
jgi:hypothetical protein